MKNVLLALVLFTVPVMAQEQAKPSQKPPAEKTVQKLVALKYANPSAVYTLLSVFPVNMQYNPSMRVISISGSESAVMTAAEAIKELDVPSAAPKDIELTAYYLSGSDAESQGGNPPPADLAAVITQLKNAFPFKEYRLLDVLRLRTRSGESAETGGMADSSVEFNGQKQPIVTRFRIHSATPSPDGSTVRIDGLQSSTRVPILQGPNALSNQDINLNTDLDVKEGQKAVVGRMGLEHNKALFLVLTAKIVE
jgi:hypothetical protein